MTSGTRRFVMMAVAIVAAVPASYWFFLRGSEAVVVTPPLAVLATSPDAGALLPVELRLGSISGHVQVRHGDAGWQDADGGEVLATNDGVRTDDGSYALLIGGEFWDVKMESGTEVSLGELSASISRLLLESGMAHADVHSGQHHTFEVRAAGSDAIASTDGGTFTMATNGQGTVAVATENGEVVFSAAGRVVLVRTGQRSLSNPGQPPQPPTPIPNSVLLKVNFPVKKTINTPKIMIVGNAEPGSLVEVLGHSSVTDEVGHFAVPIGLKEGRNSITVKAQSAGGARSTTSRTVELDTTVSGPVIDPKSLWK